MMEEFNVGDICRCNRTVSDTEYFLYCKVNNIDHNQFLNGLFPPGNSGCFTGYNIPFIGRIVKIKEEITIYLTEYGGGKKYTYKSYYCCDYLIPIEEIDNDAVVIYHVFPTDLIERFKK